MGHGSRPSLRARIRPCAPNAEDDDNHDTSNFDAQFTSMPIHSPGSKSKTAVNTEHLSNSFDGFTFEEGHHSPMNRDGLPDDDDSEGFDAEL